MQRFKDYLTEENKVIEGYLKRVPEHVAKNFVETLQRLKAMDKHDQSLAKEMIEWEYERLHGNQDPRKMINQALPPAPQSEDIISLGITVIAAVLAWMSLTLLFKLLYIQISIGVSRAVGQKASNGCPMNFRVSELYGGCVTRAFGKAMQVPNQWLWRDVGFRQLAAPEENFGGMYTQDAADLVNKRTAWEATVYDLNTNKPRKAHNHLKGLAYANKSNGWGFVGSFERDDAGHAVGYYGMTHSDMQVGQYTRFKIAFSVKHP